MSDFKEVTITGNAIPKQTGGRRRGTRKARQDGGDNSGALLQLANQSAPAGVPDPNAQALAAQFQGQVKQVLNANFGPNKQWGGDNSGALMQLSAQSTSGAGSSANMMSQIKTALTQFGPNKQWGGNKQHGGDVVASGVVLASSRAPTLPGSPPPVPVVSGEQVSQPASVGGARLVLAPPKRKTRISLKSKKRGGSVPFSNLTNIPPQPGGGHTRKARKIHLRVKGVTSRLAKAKKAKKAAESAPLTTIKQKLESAGVVKKGSKAPEKMLRTMYADLLITKKGL